MATTSSRSGVARRLREYRRSDGNWRLKGLLLSLVDDIDPADVGRAWPRSRPTTERDYVNLGARHSDTHENGVARELYGADAIRHAEVVPKDEYVARALTSEGETELDVLWRKELLATVQDGAATRKIARDATTVTPVEARRGDLTVHEQEPFASTGGVSASASFDEEGYTTAGYVTEKFEQGFAVTEELVDQAEVAQVERQIEAAGAAVENAINRQHLTNVVDNANQDHTVSGNEAAAQDVLEAAENVTDNDFDPVDTAIVHAELRTELADDINALVNMTGDEDGFPARGAFGLHFYIGSDATYNGLSGEQLTTTNTWGWEAGSEIGGVVYGSPFVHTVVYRDVGVSELDSPVTDVRDIQGGVARAQTDSVLADTNAVSTITQ